MRAIEFICGCGAMAMFLFFAFALAGMIQFAERGEVTSMLWPILAVLGGIGLVVFVFACAVQLVINRCRDAD